MVCDVLHKHLKFKACKLQLVNGLTEPDEALHLVFSANVQKLLENDKYRKKGNTTRYLLSRRVSLSKVCYKKKKKKLGDVTLRLL